MNLKNVPSFLFFLGAIFVHAKSPSFIESAETLPPGVWTLETSLLMRDNPVDFGIADRDYEIRAPQFKLALGAGQIIEIQLEGDAAVWMKNLDGETSTNSGDWTLATKVWFATETEKRPSMSFYYAVKLPNGSDELGGATDETDFFAHLLFDKSLSEKIRAHGVLGLGILGNPFTNAAQNDVISYGLSLDYRFNRKNWLIWDIGGETGPKVKDDPKGMQFGWSHDFTKWTGFGAVGFGFGDDQENFRFLLGMRRQFGPIKRNPPQRRHRGNLTFGA